MASYTCTSCGIQFTSYPSWQRAKDGSHYCSHKCQWTQRRTRVTCRCEGCGSTFVAARTAEPLRQRFCPHKCYRTAAVWAQVERLPDGHWRWRQPQASPYPRVSWHSTGEYVHRLLWRLTGGTLESGENLVRTCDRVGCVNPGHWSKTANARRPRRHFTWLSTRKLTREQVEMVWAMHKQGAPVYEIRRAVPVSSGALYGILRGYTYRELMPGAVGQAA